MVNIFDKIKNNPLWDGIEYGDFGKMFNCINAKTRIYKKSEIVLLSGDSVKFIGLVLSGGVRIIKEDADGNSMILTELAASELFGEAFACAGIMHSPVTVQAAKDSEILFIDYKKIICSCSSACSFHSKLIENMLKIIAEKNLLLNQKIEIISKRTTREKLIAFFDLQRNAAKKFSIPYNREELANYLCVDRSALSGELCKMRGEGLLKFHKNKFEIL
jgi:CRP-like cAMP-binding protein